VTGDEGCHPRRYGDIYPCTVTFRAEASDPDGDALSYRWSGCASGQAAEASCVIDQLHTVTASVEVTDGRGGRAQASKSAEGTNLPPVPGDFVCRYRPGQNPGAPDCGAFEVCPPPIPTNGIGDCIDGSFGGSDLEGDRLDCGPIIASGACHGPVYAYECGGVASAFSFEFRTGADEGECVLEISVSDSWGATSSTTVRVPVREYP
jgi:hypothetical protein